MPLALLALAVVAFGIGTTEFATMGLLPQIADGIGVSVPQAGNVVSAYALGVVVGAPLLTGIGARVPHKRLLLWLSGLFVVGNVASAFAPDFGLLFAARFLAGLPHGALFGVGAVVASRLVAPDRAARAVSKMFLGLTVANIVGVPAGTALGQQLGWRAAYGAVAVIGVVALVALALFVPHQPRGRQSGIRHELRAMGNRQVAIGLGTAVIGFGGFFAVYSYLVPMLTNLTGLSDSSTTLVLALYGVGMTLGTLVAGPLTDRALRPTLYGGLALLAAGLVVFYFAVHSTVGALITITFIGAMGSLITTPVQMLLMAKAKNAPTMAAASNHSAFNLANAGGAWLGGLAIAAGWGWASPSLVGAALAVAGLGLAVAGGVMDRRDGGSAGSEVITSSTAEARPEAAPTPQS
ncbi:MULTISPECIES: MFS transporter [unclassified Streptomyces]|uniref:MFS transporter n=1 Tax=unclassified Streptomyces TaxID=2593676 RepID=UPI00074AC6D7|nr:MULTISPECIES: MFS transporter [unclassified Streptomyces]KUL73821.1 MFS transporter [Streptomyces sp. NRRL WC-3605]KUL73896.1 MFS transporter [Streptomyces sp. NRRL WC-3604]